MSANGKTPGAVVVGTGFGARIHVPAARRAGLDVVALVGRDRAKTARRAERAGVETACDSLEEALRLPGADIVVISTPPATHAELVEQAIAAGRHVLVEKPFTVDAAEARRLEEAADRAGVVALVGHQFRFAPERVTFQHVITSGAIGAPRLGTFIGHSSLAAPLDMRAPDWWFDPARGGGWLGASASHLVDALRVWLGEFESVSATLPMVSGRDPVTDAEDSVSARFRMRSGCEVVVQQTAGAWGRPVQLTKVAGTTGSVEISGTDVLLSDAADARAVDRVGPPLPVDVEASNDPRHAFTHLELGPAVIQASVLRDLATGATPSYDDVPPATFADGVACMQVLDAVRRSAREGGQLVPV